MTLDFPLPGCSELKGCLDSITHPTGQGKLTVDLSDLEKKDLVRAGLGLTLKDFGNALAKAAIRNRRIDRRAIAEVHSEKRTFVRRSGILEVVEPETDLNGVGGLDMLKTWFRQRRKAFTDRARTFGIEAPKGILLFGVPGCGKSLVAKACAASWSFPLLRLDTGALFSSRVGESEANMRSALRTTEAISPAVLWIDEIEKALAGTGSSSYADAGVTARVFATLANWLQDRRAPVFVIATANAVTRLPPELLRKGRFDEMLFLDLPGENERRAIFRVHLKKRKQDPELFDIDRLAVASDGYSGAEIEQAVVSALFEAFDQDRLLTTGDIVFSLESQVPISVTMEDQIQALRAWAAIRARPVSGDRIDEERRRWRKREIRPA